MQRSGVFNDPHMHVGATADSPSPPSEYCTPSPISRDDIIRALETAPKIYRTSNKQIARISQWHAVKYGSDVHICEATAMRFASRLPHVPVPKVFDAWETITTGSGENQTKTTYILMQFIEGHIIADVWQRLSSDCRLNIYEQVRGMVQQLQETAFDQPGPLGGGISHGAYFTDYGAGPFLTVRDMEDWFDERLLVCKDFGRVSLEIPSFAGSFHRLVLCHLDLHDRNMILDPFGKVWLIDWAHAGAYPPYFELAGLLKAPNPEFTRKLSEIIDDGQFTEEVRRLEGLTFALTTGILLKPASSPASTPS